MLQDQHRFLQLIIMNKYSISANLLKDHYEGPIQINFSPSLGYRSRCEFGYQNKSYTMHALNGKKIYLNTFEVARPCISNLMPKFLDAINKNELINLKLFQIFY